MDAMSDLFESQKSRDRERLLAAGWRPDAGAPGYWWTPNGLLKEPEEIALIELDKSEKERSCDGKS